MSTVVSEHEIIHLLREDYSVNLGSRVGHRAYTCMFLFNKYNRWVSVQCKTTLAYTHPYQMQHMYQFRAVMWPGCLEFLETS